MPTCHDTFAAARAERLEYPLTKGQYKIAEARQDIAAWRELVLTITARLRTGGKFRTDENLGPCTAEGRGAYLKGLPARLARLIGFKILPGIAALAGDGMSKAEVECLLRRAEADAELLIADCESLRLRLKGGIKHEYDAMLQGESSLTGLSDAASELLPVNPRA